ncbi:RHS repeat-associated core domain-containing protein [Pseudomonas sp. BF-R-24]|uniref:RHS repeat-associated core domain-containing protein n=1 Tax=Pseudomonas sp. BF-R-24 TaxID=2832386 RepID=UPI001CBC8B4B|nr:RHS repeat-associated core domain-containing protein [Pseudomonas sp. BF-R-24]
MPASPRETVLCRYHYDALDRLDNSAPAVMDSLQRFYCKTRLATEIQGSVRNSIFQHEDRLLAQQRHENTRIDSSLLATDQQRSVLNVLNTTGPQPVTYTAYGHRSPENGLLSLLGFNGERRDPLTGHYPLGFGYRQFNPVTMRFNSPDSLSPFGDGGLNGYAYCVGDPVNRSDPTGHFSVLRILIGVSGTVSVGAYVGSLVVEDKTVRFVLTGLSFAAGVTAGGGVGFLKYQSRPPRLQRSNLASQQGEIALGDVSPGRRRADPPPPYPGSHRLPQPASSRPSVSEQFDVPPPSYEEAVGSIDRLRAPQNLESQPSLPPHQPPRRTLSSRSLSSSDIGQEAWQVRRLT